MGTSSKWWGRNPGDERREEGDVDKGVVEGFYGRENQVERGGMHARKEEEKPSEIRNVTRPMMIRMTMPSSTSEEAA